MDRDIYGHQLQRPARWHGGVIVCSPHSGRDYPDWFLDESPLDVTTLRSSEDAFIDRLIEPALAAGAVTLCARLPRCIIDLNRGPGELDPKAVQCPVAARATQRARAGLGVIPRIVSGGRVIRRHLLSAEEAQRRIDTYWHPYHAALRGLIAEACARFGQAVVLDMHSMPHEAVRRMVPPVPQVVIGDRNGASCGALLRDQVAGLFMAEGYRVHMNAPFSGAYVTAAYGRPTSGVHVLQIELDRALYLDEARLVPGPGYGEVAARLGRILQAAARLGPGTELRLAAE